jgi:hypothetical protein
MLSIKSTLSSAKDKIKSLVGDAVTGGINKALEQVAAFKNTSVQTDLNSIPEQQQEFASITLGLSNKDLIRPLSVNDNYHPQRLLRSIQASCSNTDIMDAFADIDQQILAKHIMHDFSPEEIASQFSKDFPRCERVVIDGRTINHAAGDEEQQERMAALNQYWKDLSDKPMNIKGAIENLNQRIFINMKNTVAKLIHENGVAVGYLTAKGDSYSDAILLSDTKAVYICSGYMTTMDANCSPESYSPNSVLLETRIELDFSGVVLLLDYEIKVTSLAPAITIRINPKDIFEIRDSKPILNRLTCISFTYNLDSSIPNIVAVRSQGVIDYTIGKVARIIHGFDNDSNDNHLSLLRADVERFSVVNLMVANKYTSISYNKHYKNKNHSAQLDLQKNTKWTMIESKINQILKHHEFLSKDKLYKILTHMLSQCVYGDLMVVINKQLQVSSDNATFDKFVACGKREESLTINDNRFTLNMAAFFTGTVGDSFVEVPRKHLRVELTMDIDFDKISFEPQNICIQTDAISSEVKFEALGDCNLIVSPELQFQKNLLEEDPFLDGSDYNADRAESNISTSISSGSLALESNKDLIFRRSKNSGSLLDLSERSSLSSVSPADTYEERPDIDVNIGHRLQ